jgi:hypothetical protein
MGVGFVEISGAPSSFGAAAMILLILLVVLWFIIATAAALKGDAVEPPNRVAQMYGYTVCLVAVILGVTSMASIVEAAFDRAHPLQTEYSYGASLTSFEAYRATHARERMLGPSEAATPDTASDATLQRRYDALVADRLAASSYRTSKTFVTSGIMFVVSAILFLVHWRWLRRMPGPGTTAR